MKRPLWVHPVLWALCPILFLYAHNFAEMTPDALILPMALAIIGALLLWGVLAWRIRDRDTAAVTTSWIVIFVFLYGHLYGLITRESQLIASWPIIFFILWLIILLGVSLVLLRSHTSLEGLSAGLNIAALVFTVYLVIVTGHLEFVRYTQHLAAPQVKMQQGRGADPHSYPDIYYIILDAHIRSDALKTVFGGDNSDLLNRLRKKGFYIADRSRSNYSATITSLPSSLNMNYLTEVAQRVGPRSNDRAPLRDMITNPLLCQVLRAHGYT
ncbi:MAG TPA: hypothetical protein VGM23_06665, partial [Armatimonadota bacterium]